MCWALFWVLFGFGIVGGYCAGVVLMINSRDRARDKAKTCHANERSAWARLSLVETDRKRLEDELSGTRATLELVTAMNELRSEVIRNVIRAVKDGPKCVKS